MTQSLAQPIQYEGPGIRLVLSGDSSRVQAQAIIDRAKYPEAKAALLEVLHQARNAQGLPMAAPYELWRQELLLTQSTTRQFAAQTVFPGCITPDIAPACYYRVTPLSSSRNSQQPVNAS